MASSRRSSASVSETSGVTSNTAVSSVNEEKVILVVGACGLDRLLTVKSYPEEDAKVRTTNFHEIGGGNAANTAAAIGRLIDAECFRNPQTGTPKIKVQYLGKVGADPTGQQLLDELRASNVDVSSPLCMQPKGTTTSVTTVVVTEDTNTRTCIHTPGTCGELQVHDLFAHDLGKVFSNVVHLHSDSRHTYASLFLVKKAKQYNPNITVSCDCEKDRKSPALDELLQLSDCVFTNSKYLQDYLNRLTRQMEDDHDVAPLPPPHVNDLTNRLMDSASVNSLARSLAPSAFLTRWFPRRGRQVIVTRGEMGAIHYEATSIQSEFWNGEDQDFRVNNMDVTTLDDSNNGSCNISPICTLHHRFSRTPLDSFDRPVFQEAVYRIHPVGTWKDLRGIVDSTGAGDAFIGGYLLAKIAAELSEGWAKNIQTSPSVPSVDESSSSSWPSSSSAATLLAMRFGTWVAGNKLQGPGARNGLPFGRMVDTYLGRDLEIVAASLEDSMTPFQ